MVTKRLLLLLAVVLVSHSIDAVAQAGNGQVTGVVQDPTKALVPGVTVTLTNTNTGITNTQITNESGVYTFQSVPPGTYSASASLPGFKTSITTGVQVSLVPVRVNITLEVGALDNKVEVTAAADAALAETSASVGVVLSQRRITELPMVGGNVLDLLSVLPGFRENPGNDAASTVGGLSLDYVNTTVNGLSTVSSKQSPAFWGRQILTTNVINPDLVGEIRLILSPVDAELGRGNSQVQITTRSGTNKFNGAVNWNAQNTALNSRTWASKRVPNPVAPDWYNLHEITASYGGPIKRNKTFFFVLWDKQLVNRRTLISTPVLTDTARQGIYRYWEGWNPGNALTPDPTSFVSAGTQPVGTFRAVDFDGNPFRPLNNPTGGPYTLGGLRCFSLFGDKKVGADGQMLSFTQADCPGGTAVINPGPWDRLRAVVDPTGYMQRILKQMPHPDFFAGTGTDGLNTATYRWLQGRKGANTTNALQGVANTTADYNNRDQINVKIDHNITSSHRVNVSWTYEKDLGSDGLSAWGSGLDGNLARHPQFVTVNAVSTLSPKLVNEARMGINYSRHNSAPAWANLLDSSIRDKAREYVLYGGANPSNGKKYPILYNPGANWNGVVNFGAFDLANFSPLYDYADTLRWTRGKHSLNFGGEYRRPSTVGWTGGAYVAANPGNAGGTTATPLFFSNANLTNGANLLPNFLATARNDAGTMLSTFYGAINAPNTSYWIDGQPDLKAGTWQDVTTAINRIQSADPYGHQTRGQIQNEWGFFFKDDFKMTSRLTLNLGVRWDFIGSPYLTHGLTNRIDGDGLGLFGISRTPGVDPFSTWLTPGNTYLSGYGSAAATPLRCVNGAANPNGLPASNCNPDEMSRAIFVGPETDNPKLTLVPQAGRFSPAIGFSWQVPWFDSKPTTVRGGFQRTYGIAGARFSGGLLSGPGADGSASGVNINDPRWAAIFATRAANLTDLPLAVPATPTRAPQDRVFPVGQRNLALGYAHYDPDYRMPYTDNWTLTIQHSLNRTLTLEIRSVNTLGRDQGGAGGSLSSAGSFNINAPAIFKNQELFQALEMTRRGENAPLFDQMLMGMNLNPTVAGYGPVGTTPVGGVLQRGSAQLRKSTTFATALANGNYVTVVNNLLTAGSTGTGGLRPLPIDPATGVTLVTSQRALRNGCDRIADGLTGGFVNPDTGQTILPRCFPENYLIANPQFSTAVYAKNLGRSDYNALEVQLTMRPVHGLSLTATYGISKTMNQPGSGFTDPLRPELDYGLSGQSVGSDFRTNGTFELPIGPNKLLLTNSSGWLARAIERWQLGFIANVSAGAPRTFLSGFDMLYGNGRPNIVGPWTNPKGSVKWNGQNGEFFSEEYATYVDPQCLGVTTADGLRDNCSLRGLAKVVPQGTSGAIPLTNGTFGIPLLENPRPGQQGNLGAYTLSTLGRWSLDTNLSKTFKIDESKSVQFRLDAKNILNHPTPADPVGLTNAGSSFADNFGQVTSKTGSRTFQARLRVTF